MNSGPHAAGRRQPLNVYYTVDVEVWCDGWSDIDAKFPSCFRQYIDGATPAGDFGVGFQARTLKEHGLRGTFFVEPLFSLRFGQAWLDEVVSQVLTHDQDLQLHLHTEWVDEARDPPLAIHGGKRQYLRQFSEAEQIVLLGLGRELLRTAGAPSATCFRAGSFGFNSNTLSALARVGIPMDASYNATMFGPDSGVAPGQILTDCLAVGAVAEFPMTVFRDGTRRLRHAQLTACSWRELESLLWQAHACGQKSFVILSHGSELLTRSRKRPDGVVVQRFLRLCRFLDQNRGYFSARTFGQGLPALSEIQPEPLRSTSFATGLRIIEQIVRRREGFA